jgi:putative ABC transport system substrate-binding protein
MQFDKMRRRAFITLLGGAAAWPIVARGQQPSPTRPLIGLLSPLSAVAASRNVTVFRSALRDLGYLEGRNMTLALRYGDEVAERMPSLARELVALDPDVILTGAVSGALAAYNATRTIPIVTITPEDPVKAGFSRKAGPCQQSQSTWRQPHRFHRNERGIRTKAVGIAARTCTRCKERCSASQPHIFSDANHIDGPRGREPHA